LNEIGLNLVVIKSREEKEKETCIAKIGVPGISKRCQDC